MWALVVLLCLATSALGAVRCPLDVAACPSNLCSDALMRRRVGGACDSFPFEVGPVHGLTRHTTSFTERPTSTRAFTWLNETGAPVTRIVWASWLSDRTTSGTTRFGHCYVRKFSARGAWQDASCVWLKHKWDWLSAPMSPLGVYEWSSGNERRVMECTETRNDTCMTWTTTEKTAGGGEITGRFECDALLSSGWGCANLTGTTDNPGLAVGGAVGSCLADDGQKCLRAATNVTHTELLSVGANWWFPAIFGAVALWLTGAELYGTIDLMNRRYKQSDDICLLIAINLLSTVFVPPFAFGAYQMSGGAGLLVLMLGCTPAANANIITVSYGVNHCEPCVRSAGNIVGAALASIVKTCCGIAKTCCGIAKWCCGVCGAFFAVICGCVRCCCESRPRAKTDDLTDTQTDTLTDTQTLALTPTPTSPAVGSVTVQVDSDDKMRESELDESPALAPADEPPPSYDAVFWDESTV